MQAIRLDFDPNSLSRIENLILVLEFIRGESLGINEYTVGAIPPLASDYIEQFKIDQGLSQEDGLSVAVITRLNEVWMEKKYTQDLYINELHTWLTTLDYDIHPEELESKTMGESTTSALEQAQGTYQLPVTGTMSVALEQELLEDYNIVTNNNREELLQVNDVDLLKEVTAPLILNEEGQAVQHLQLALAWLGYEIYKSEYRAAFFGHQTRLSVLNYQKKHSLVASGELTTAMADHLNKQLLISKPTLLNEQTYRVKGSIKDQNWQGIAEAIIEVYEQLLRAAPVLLGQTTTDSEGNYELVYNPPIDATTSDPKDKFHLLIQVKDLEGTLLKEESLFNVSTTTWVNYTAGNLPYLGKSYYETQIETLTPHLAGLKIEEIEESEINQDITYLNASSGLGGNEIMLLSLAHRIAQQWLSYGIDPSVLYAFFKQQLPQSLPSYLLPDELSEWNTWITNLTTTQATAIALLPRTIQEAALQQSAEENILPRAQYSQLSTILDQLDQVRAYYAETAPIIGQGVALKDILVYLPELPAGEKTAIIDEFANSPQLSSSFIKNLEEQGLISAITEQQFQQEYLVFELGNKNLEETSNLKNAFNQEGYSTIVTQASDFAKWSVADWQTYINNLPLINGNPSTNLEAEDFYNKAVGLSPTIAALSSLDRTGKGTLHQLTTIQEEVDQQQWLNLVEVPLLELEQDPEFVFPADAMKELKIVQRVQKIAPSPTTMAILIDEGIQSAQQAFKIGTAGISNALQQGGMPTEEANINAAQIYSSAQQQVGAVLGLGTAIQLIGNNQLPTNVLPQLVDIEELFGSTDTCACAHCRSVYSPAAYLTDLLQWLKRDGNEDGNTALQVLLDRRPDLEYILLNCKNAHTPLPYIDLVNEVLEHAISQYDSQYLKRNTTWTAEALRVQPEYQWNPVYEQFALLSNDVNFKPIASYNGFNLWQSQFHLYLQKLGINSYELVQELEQYSNDNKKIVADTAAYFVMPSYEVYDIITPTDYDYGAHPAASNNVEQFLKYHELTYEQLVLLLQSVYINPDNSLEIIPVGSCTLSEQTINNLTDAHYNKIWRFLRLWKYTGWELRELDLAIAHPKVGQGKLDLNALNQLIKIHQLQHQLGVSLEASLTLLGDMNTQIWSTANNQPIDGFYQRVYLADHLEEGLKANFLPSNFNLNLQAPTDAQLNYIAAALGTNVSSLQTLLSLPTLETMTQVGGTPVAQATNLTALSNLYAYQLLATTLKIELEELVEIVQLLDAGNNTNIVQDIDTLQAYLEAIAQWRSQGIAVVTVQYLQQEEGAAEFLSQKEMQAWQDDLYALLDEAYDNLIEETQTDRELLGKLLEQTGKFTDRGQVEDFLNVLEDPNQLTSIILANDIPVFFDYISTDDQNALITAIAANDPANPNPQIITDIKYYLHRYLNRAVVYDFLSEQLNVSTELLAWSLEQDRSPDTLISWLMPRPHQGSFAIYGSLIISYQYAHKFALLVHTFGLELEDLLVLEDHAALLNLIQPSALPTGAATPAFTIEEWNTTWAWWQLSEQYPIAPKDWFAALATLNTDNDLEGYFAELEMQIGWEAALLSELQTAFNWSVNDYLTPEQYPTLAKKIALLQQTQEQLAVVLEWPKLFDITLPNYLEEQQIIAHQVQQTVQKAVAPSQWATYQEQVQGQLRQLKRDALVAYARHYAPDGSAALLSINELYKYYLIDPGMSSCQYTSRIKQAISSVQLFVQRALMGLEENVDIKADVNWTEWEWMQNYRVWEANRKVFLYPENWIEPALRDDKTELFKQFEDQLLQAEITSENVEKSLQDYLVKLHHIANLEMKSICQGADQNTIYVLARTKENPADYYYRKLDKLEGTWTGWEKIESAIKGEHPVLQFYNGRLHLFWLEILEKPQDRIVQNDRTLGANVTARPILEGNVEHTAELPKYKEIKLAWITLYKSGWSSQTLSKDTLIHPWPNPNYSLHLRPRPFSKGTGLSRDLWLDVYMSTSVEFNNRKFYNQFRGQYEKLTTVTFDENKRPQHTSSFVFDGFVKEIKIKPISGTYWYVGWAKQLTGTSTPVSNTVYLFNEGAVWITELKLPSTSSGSGGFGPNSSGSTQVNSWISTNYGTYYFSGGTDGRKIYNLNQLIDDKKASNAPSIVITGLIKDNNTVVCKTEINGVNQNLSKQELNNYIQLGIKNPLQPATQPTRVENNSIFSPSGYKLVLASDPNHILELNNSNAHEYVYHSFDKEGRKIKSLLIDEVRGELERPDGMHYEYNHLVPNRSIDTGGKDLEILTSTDPQTILTKLLDREQDYTLTIPLSADLDVKRQYNDILYQDDLRSFYLAEKNHQTQEYSIYAMYHPLSRKILGRLGNSGLKGLYSRSTQYMEEENLTSYYQPTNKINPNYNTDITVEQVNFENYHGYGIYNQELFFHIPLMIATELSKNQRFEEAMQWFHFIFDPRGVPFEDSATPAGSQEVSQYWITKPFFEQSQQGYQDSLIQNLLGGSLSQETMDAIENWRKKPFQPYAVARMRPVAYQKAVVMKYIDNLIAWGDQLYRRETLESINQASLRYMMAAEILGDQPHTFVAKEVQEEDYATLKTTLDEFSNTSPLVQLEHAVLWTDRGIEDIDTPKPPINWNDKYFCIPKNEKLASYWDLVGDRLFKIRHCMNIDGVVRQLPLFAPPIDPALLVQAQANGVDIGTVLNGRDKSKIHYKYRALSRLAMQFCGEVKSLGQSLLSALQSKDAEGMALLQSSNGLRVLNATIALKNLQIQEAEENIKSLELSKAAAEFRKEFYEGRSYMNGQEKAAEGINRTSIILDQVGMVIEGIAALVTPIPKIEAHVGLAAGVNTEIVDGQRIASILNLISSTIYRNSGILSKEASMAATQGSYQRRQEEWDMQAELATRDIEQIEQQIATAQLRVALAQKDLEVHQLQIENAQSEQEYLQSKYTNQQLYTWMVGQLSKTYYQAYQLAFDMAKQAEESMHYELALPTAAPKLVKFGYWDSMKKGLLAGDQLMLAINKMEALYVEKNSRDLELTKHLSLHQLAPEQLLQLKTTGSCELSIPEWWFDMDYPGHYLRRIKALSVSIPCVTGPNTTVACTLTMTKNAIRTKEEGVLEYYGTQSIATSSGQNDAGVFELNFNDERFLPFEGAGVISTWTLKLPKRASFDYQSITDVVFHMRYQAKDGGALKAEEANTRVEEQLERTASQLLEAPVVLLSLKTAFPTAWHRFLNPEVAGNPAGTHQLNFEVMNKHFPYFSSLFANRTLEAAEVGVLLKEPLEAASTLAFPMISSEGVNTITTSVTIDSNNNSSYGNTVLSGFSTVPVAKSDVINWQLDLTDTNETDLAVRKAKLEKIEDIFLLLKYKVS